MFRRFRILVECTVENEVFDAKPWIPHFGLSRLNFPKIVWEFNVVEGYNLEPVLSV
jgi:hypothetical protein